MYQITINDKKYYIEDGTLLSEFLMKQGIQVDHPCGGSGTCGKCKVLVNGKEERSCKYKVTSDISVRIPDRGNVYSVTGVEECESANSASALVLDLGTTTLAMGLISSEEQKVIRTITATNPQRKYGADVISRITHCQKYGVKKLQEAVVSCINQMILDLEGEEQLGTLYVSGNTIMLHLLLGEDCSGMGMSPYTPVFLESRTVSAKNIGVFGVQEIVTLPCISSFVGADLVAGLNCVEMPKKGAYSFLIDLGTNAEIILFSDEDLLCASAAAGPCFEGVNISSGMSATKGAIYSYTYPKEYKTIENAKAKGICGTGLIDVIAELLKHQVIDASGYMEEAFEVAEGIFLEPKDVRQYQLAKSAVCAGVLTLMNARDLSFEQIDKVYISGGFSASINQENAIRTGLFPKEFASKCIAINNSSFLGTVKYACGHDVFHNHIEYAEYMDLSLNTFFAELFMKKMMF